MFKIGDDVICVEIGSFYWSRNPNNGTPDTLTVGKTYKIINWENNYVYVINDEDRIRKYSDERFVHEHLFRKIKLDKICKKMKV
jgi:hypothetical protein